jgi:hypothetical protein
MGKECLSCDGMAETFVYRRDFGKYLAMQMDPEYAEKVLPGLVKYVDVSKMEFTVGVEVIAMAKTSL